MTVLRSAIFGGVAALGVPVVVKALDFAPFDFLMIGARPFRMAGLLLHWSWPIFVVITLFAFLLLKFSGDR